MEFKLTERPQTPNASEPRAFARESSLLSFACCQCGAELQYAPGTTRLKCQYCTAENEIPEATEPIEELDFDQALADLSSGQECVDRITIRCDSCRADFEMAPTVTSQSCPFCGSNIVATSRSQRLLKPRSLLPFKVEHRQARDLFVGWLKSRWFAPSDLKRLASVQDQSGGATGSSASGSGLAGMYLPYWTYDAKADTSYTGQRGDDYTVTVGSGQNRRTERRTRWSFVSGRVQNSFDDVLVSASSSLPPERLASLGAWDLKDLVPYSDAYLSGFRAESYTIDLKGGFVTAKSIMDDGIRATIRRDIGGDHQRIVSMSPRFSGITFKHLLLPVWVSAYRYNTKVYRFFVNARTGTVTGERPYSVLKIVAAVIAGLIALGIIVAIVAGK